MTTLADYPDESRALCDVCHRLGAGGLCRATSGNFSLRLKEDRFLITQSGKEKSRLEQEDLMICDAGGHAIDSRCKPSAETPLHARLYQLDFSIGAVLHTHSVAATILSQRSKSQLLISGFEMQKALTGNRSHDVEICVPVFDNSQDMNGLAEIIARAWGGNKPTVPGFLIRGHGLYAWGTTLDEAERHVEGFEFLFECLWQEMLMGHQS